ncbi:hypothetical protein JXA88_18455 [Candidatus Fermentibacteria bacterium]|nr:hypothetical protein [Candidatus Fermentibacteria bacterium]
MKELTLEIGGLSTTIVVPEEPIAEVLLDRYAAFLIPETTDESIIRVELLTGSLEQGYRAPTIVSDGDTITVTRHDLSATSRNRGKTWHARMIANEYTFDSCLRVLYTLRLLEHEGFLVHASAQLRNGIGCIFTGKSEAGKSTISRLGTDNLVLCDELPMVRKVNGGYRVWGTPFWGEFGKGTITASGDVKTVFFLNKAPFNRSTPLSSAKALPRLLQTTLFFSRDRTMVDAAMQRCMDFLDHVSAFDLYFRPEPGVWEAVDSALPPA